MGASSFTRYGLHVTFFCSQAEKAMKGRCLATTDEIKTATLVKLKAILKKLTQKLQKLKNKLIQVYYIYFEGDNIDVQNK